MSDLDQALAEAPAGPEGCDIAGARIAPRRAFLRRSAAVGLGAAALMFLSPPAATLAGETRPKREDDDDDDDDSPPQRCDRPAAFPGVPGGDINQVVLNFALTLEILEADLYRQALNKASGRPLRAPLEAKPGAYRLRVRPGRFPDEASASAAFLYLKQFAYVEAAHRDFLQSALAAAAVKPNPGGYRFPGGLDDDLSSIMNGILPLEETCVCAGDPDDVTGLGSNLEPRRVQATLTDGGAGPDTVRLVGPGAAAAAEGAYLLLAGAGLEGVAGRTYQLASLVGPDSNTWTLAEPGISAADEEIDDAYAYLAGRGLADPAHPALGFEGPAQDIAVHRMIVSARTTAAARSRAAAH